MTESDNTPTPRPVVLCILDGWGEREETENNAIALGRTPNWDRLVNSVPRARLNASGEEVGLPLGQFGNSEVGHTNLGAGRIVLQDLPRIDAAIQSGELAKKPELGGFIEKLKASGGTCHLLGLLSPGGVHSHVDQMLALAGMVAGAGVPVAVHAFLDGRDTPPRDGLQTMREFLEKIKPMNSVFVATVCGRYYPMDRDQRWERVEKAYQALVSADGETADDPVAAISASYSADLTDEFMRPTVIGDYAGMIDGDGVLVANFRADRARQILTALVNPDFDGFDRRVRPDFAARLGLIEYSSELNQYFDALFRSDVPPNILGQVVSEAGMLQLRIAETEKYAHVTFFLNGGREDVFPGEERILVASPKVATYDLQPEMSAEEVTDNLVRVIGEGRMDLIVVNYANGDMVGHTGIMAAAVRAAECLDTCLGRLEDALKAAGGVLLVTADHGNCEDMLDQHGNQPHTQHTTNMVPVLMVNAPPGVRGLKDGRLSDVAPTLLELLGLAQPAEMTGQSLIEYEQAETAVS
ncbi:MAG: 2,3-bisphosphoglycerate-independent phosphoglycerate mutase [Proteobacteria bacterium]|nr:2,3-bisphosphoglycerate-independent phosphoglycerate mutase [Pseudomonadota bacterium]MDA1022802.1 2,3-bisphosphoglycerate-independent phosphoglycerate mutase [Pseudomonadota bacterium]